MVERVVFPFRGAELGGSHVATFTLARAIQTQSQVECVVLCPQDTLIMEEAKRLGIRTIASEEQPTGSNNALTDLTGIARRRRILERERAGCSCVVHCNDINTLRAWGLPARLSQMGVVYHHHALNRMWWPPHLVSLTYANAIVCVSDSTMAAMEGWRPDATKALKCFGYTSWFSLMFMCGVYLTFPLDDLKPQIVALIEDALGKGKQGQYGVDPKVQLGDLALSGFGVSAERVAIHLGNNEPEAGPTVDVDELSLDVRP